MKEYIGAPRSCDACHGEFGTVMYDASVNGRWGNLCHSCFTAYRCKLGTGRGQKFELREGKWVKTDG